jgi:hypothetical protein
VEVGGGDQRAVVSRVGEQLGDGNRVLDELLAGLLAVLAEVDAAGESGRVSSRVDTSLIQ